MKQAKNTICLWYNRDAEDAARFYASTFPDSSVDAVHLAPGDFPSGKKGDVLTVEFTVMGVACLGLNGGPAFKHNEAFSQKGNKPRSSGGRVALKTAIRVVPVKNPKRMAAPQQSKSD